MDTSYPRHSYTNASFNLEVIIYERRNVAFQPLLTAPLQLQSVLNSPSIKTNEITPESEQSRVRGLLQGLESELEIVDIQIAHALEYLFLLQDERAGYVENIMKLRPAIAPHKYLPSDILVEIFLHYAAEIAEKVIKRREIIYRLAPLPWVLGHICSRWRQIALAEPRIWGTIEFKAVGRDLPMLNEAFERGGKSPLWLSAGDTQECIPYSTLRDIVCSQSKRITQLSLFVHWDAFKEFLTLPQDSFPVLESVWLTVIDSREMSRPDLRDFDLRVFRGAAGLQRIDFDTTRLDMAPVRFPMNLGLCWPQLTHINFGEISTQVSIAHEFI